MSDKPKFRILKNGYDRFEVDSKIKSYEEEIHDLKRKLEFYSAKLEQSYFIMDELNKRYVNVSAALESRELIAEDISRMALKEANEIIRSAKENADIIIKEALAISRLILTDLSKLSRSVNEMKGDVKEKLDILYEDIESFKLPDLPDLKWLEEAERKMH